MRPVGLVLSDDIARIDRDVVWDFMSREAYWARWRGRNDVERQLETAWRLVGAYQAESGAMLGFARAISDGVALAYLADVFVVPSARRRGVAKALLHFMIEEGPGARFRWMLHTADAHELYRGFGFAEPDATFLERRPRR
jgi:GNAT superfamily N-acetyltransferase